MTREHENARRLADDFKQRSPTDRMDLLNLLVIEGHARLTANGPHGQLDVELHGVSASGLDPWDLIDNWCVIVDRQEMPARTAVQS